MSVKIETNLGKIRAKINAGKQAVTVAVTEAVVEYGNIYVREDQGVLMASSLIGTTLTDTVSKGNWSDEDKKNYASASAAPERGQSRLGHSICKTYVLHRNSITRRQSASIANVGTERR